MKKEEQSMEIPAICHLEHYEKHKFIVLQSEELLTTQLESLRN